MRMHNSYMIVISALFAVLFVIMIYSLAKHRKSCGISSTEFSGPTGTVQWLWALVPLAILGYINSALIELPEDRHSPAKKIERPATQNPAAVHVAELSIPTNPRQ